MFRYKKIFISIGPIAVGTLIVWLLLHQVDIATVQEQLLQVSIMTLLPFIVVLYGTHLIAVYRWQTLLFFSGAAVSYKTLCKYFFANLPLTKIFPLYSGDFLRSLYVRDHLPLARGSGVILFESFIDVLVLLGLVTVGGYMSGHYEVFLLGCVLLIASVGGLWFFSRLRLQNDRFEKITMLLETMRVLSSQPTVVMKVIGLSVCMWLCTMSFTFGAFLSLGIDVSIYSVLALQPIATLIALVPVSFGGVGTREVAMVLLYNGLAPAATIASAGVLYTVVAIIMLPLLCLPMTAYVLSGQSKTQS